jgi:hypothetical protein
MPEKRACRLVEKRVRLFSPREANCFFAGALLLRTYRNILKSENGFEFRIASPTMGYGGGMFVVDDVLLIFPQSNCSYSANTDYLSGDGELFSEIAFPDGDWGNCATDGKILLATFMPSEHEKLLMRGTMILEE